MTKKAKTTRTQPKPFLSEYLGYCALQELSGCCGIDELFDLHENPKYAVAAVLEHSSGGKELIIFSDAQYLGNGERLAKYIRRHKLGKVRGSSNVLNPNTGNLIRMWMWEPDEAALNEWQAKHFR